jgi:hypothetical protein
VFIGHDVAGEAFSSKDVMPPPGDVATCCFGVADAMFDVIDEPIDDAADSADADDAAESGRDS